MLAGQRGSKSSGFAPSVPPRTHAALCQKTRDAKFPCVLGSRTNVLSLLARLALSRAAWAKEIKLGAGSQIEFGCQRPSNMVFLGRQSAHDPFARLPSLRTLSRFPLIRRPHPFLRVVAQAPGVAVLGSVDLHQKSSE